MSGTAPSHQSGSLTVQELLAALETIPTPHPVIKRIVQAHEVRVYVGPEELDSFLVFPMIRSEEAVGPDVLFLVVPKAQYRQATEFVASVRSPLPGLR